MRTFGGGLGVSDRPDNVLAEPTRARLFARLASLAHPAGTDELAAELGLHPSGVRVHLDRLRRAGLVSRERVSQATGRPRDAWSIASANALPGSEPPDAYRLLARLLARSIPLRPGRLDEVERCGREIGRELDAGRGPGPAVEAMGRALTALGFAPQREQTADGRVQFRLMNCPYRDAVRENQPVVCTLHRGMTRGLLDALEPSALLTAFVPTDPDCAECLIEVEGLAAR